MRLLVFVFLCVCKCVTIAHQTDGFYFKRLIVITMVTAGYTSWFIYDAFATHTTGTWKTKGNVLSPTQTYTRKHIYMNIKTDKWTCTIHILAHLLRSISYYFLRFAYGWRSSISHSIQMLCSNAVLLIRQFSLCYLVFDYLLLLLLLMLLFLMPF